MTEPGAHEEQARTLFNRVWELLEEDRTPDGDVEMLHAAHASRHHWWAAGAGPVRLLRGEWQNIELISDRPFSVWIDELKQLKDEYPDGVVIASIMEEYDRDRWVEIVERVQETGVAGFELMDNAKFGQTQFQERLNPIIEQVATEKGLHVVFSVRDGGIIWAYSGIDISAEVAISTGDPFAQAHDRDLLADAIAGLSPEHRVVVALRYYRDLPIETIATRLDIPAGTVQSRLHYALKRLHAAIGAADGKGTDR